MNNKTRYSNTSRYHFKKHEDVANTSKKSLIRKHRAKCQKAHSVEDEMRKYDNICHQ